MQFVFIVDIFEMLAEIRDKALGDLYIVSSQTGTTEL